MRAQYPALRLHVPSLDALAEALVIPSPRFVLLVAADSHSHSGPILVRVAEQVLKRGANYVCCWGPGCERLHDCFDEADVYDKLDDHDAPVVMTTWHNKDSLEEAAWFALHSASPHAGLLEGTGHVVLATVGNTAWCDQLDSYLRTGTSVPDET